MSTKPAAGRRATFLAEQSSKLNSLLVDLGGKTRRRSAAAVVISRLVLTFKDGKQPLLVARACRQVASIMATHFINQGLSRLIHTN